MTRQPPDIGPDLLAEWWRRLIGWVIDSVVVGVLVAGSWVRTVHAYSDTYRIMLRNPDIDVPSFSAINARVLADGLLATFASAGIALAYYGLLTGLWGTTVGKRMLGAWVVTSAGRAKPHGKSAFIRAAVFVVGPVILFFFFADNLTLLGDKQRQCLHDKAAGTVVVKRRA